MYSGRFLYVNGLLLAVGAAAAITFFAWVAFGSHVRVETKTVDAPALGTSATVAEARARFDGDPQVMPGDQAAAAVGQSCPQVDVYPLSDGAVLVCHG